VLVAEIDDAHDALTAHHAHILAHAVGAAFVDGD
jgi:hypothetical protein